MANLITNNIQYTAQTAPEFFVGALSEAHTIESDYVRVIPNVTKDVMVKKLVLTGNTISQKDDRDCAWTPTQRMTADSVTLKVANFKINEEQCLDSLDSLYSEEVFRTGRSEGAMKTEAPGDFKEAVMYLVQKGLSADVERIIWTGDLTSGATGLVGQASASGVKVTIDVVVDPKAAVETAYENIPDAVLSEAEADPAKAPVRFFVSAKNLRSIKQFLSEDQNNANVVYQPWKVEGTKVTYMGCEVVGNPFIDNDTLLAFSRDNAVFATDLLADTANVEVEQGASLKDRSTMYIKGQYRAVAGFIFNDEVVYAHK